MSVMPGRLGGHLGIVAILALLVAAVFAQTWKFDFVSWDDPMYVTGNPQVMAGLSLEGVRWAVGTKYSGLWYPLTWLSHMTDVSFWGRNAGGHHLTSVALHMANAILLYALLVVATADRWRSFAVGALFAVHPLHVESVAWISDRKDVLMTFFFLLAMLGYVLREKSGRMRWSLLIYAAAVLASMSKPMAVSLPLVLILMDYWPLRRFASQVEPAALIASLREKWPLLVMAGLLAIFTLMKGTDAGTRHLEASELFSFADRLRIASAAYGYYLWKSFWPVELSFFYPVNTAMPLWHYVLPVGLLAAALLLFFRQRHAHPALLFGALWYCITLLPVSGIVQIGGYAYADRYSYLPLVGFFVLLVWGARMPVGSALRRGCVVMLAVGLGLLAWLAHWQAGHWKNSESLYARALEINADNRMARLGIAHTYIAKGLFEKAQAMLVPLLAGPRDQLGAQAESLAGDIAYFQGQSAVAASFWVAAAKSDPGYWRPRLRLGTLALETGDLPGAINHFVEADRLRPNSEEVLNNLGVAYVRTGDNAQALATYLRALKANRMNQTTLLNIARTYERLGDSRAAFGYYQQILALDPGHGAANAGIARLRNVPLPQ